MHAFVLLPKDYQSKTAQRSSDASNEPGAAQGQ
jgi:hypothetical protein